MSRLNHFFSRNKRVIVVILCVLILGFLLVYSRTEREKITPVESVVRDVFSPVNNFFSMIGNKISSGFDFIVSIGNMKDENEELKKRIDELVMENMRLENAARENERLLAILELRDMYQGKGSLQLAWDIYDRQGKEFRSGRWYGCDMPWRTGWQDNIHV